MINIDALNDDEKLAALESIHKSIAESKEIQRKKITTNVEMIVKALKKIEADLKQRYDETGNLIANLKSGEDGKDGRDGKDGKDGRAGKDGAIGPRGYDGLPGRNGLDGKDGVSITDAHIDFDGSLIIHLSSGRVINVGEVVTADIAEKIKVITNGGGTSQYVLDTLASLQAQISGITSGLDYQGTWNASTNTPTLTSSVGTNGYYYIVATAGSTNLNGVTDWQVGDWAVFNGTVWQKLDQTDIVTSVAGRTGAIVLTTADIGGLGTIATQAANNVSITGGSITGITDLAIADGGTGASTAPNARTNLGLVIGTDVLSPTGSAASLTSFPTLNQNTTGTAANVTGTVAIANGGTGATTTATARTNLGATTVGANVFTLTNPSAITFPRFNADNTVSALDASTFRTAIGAGTSSTTGTVTSVAATVPTFLSIGGSPITSSGTLAITLSGTALPTTSGGTGLTSFTANGVVYASSTSALATGSALTFDGSKLTVNSNSTTTAGFFQVNDGTTTQANSFGSVVRNANDGNGRYSLGAFTLQNASGLSQYAYIGAQSVTGVSNYTPDMVFGLSTGASTYAEQMRLTTTGLGIGTSSPASRLHVTGTFGSQLRLQETSGTFFDITGGGRLDIKNNAGTAIVSIAQSGNPVGTQLNLTSSGILGVGVVPSSWGSGYKVLQIGNAGFMNSGASTWFYNNSYFDGTNNVYTTTAAATRYVQASGAHNWDIAASGTAGTSISFTQAMTLNSSGNLGIGTTSPSATAKVTVRDASYGLYRAENTAGGSALFGITSNASSNGYLDASNAFLFNTDGTERMRLTSTGLGIGTTSPQGKLSVSNGTIFVGSESNTSQTNNFLNGYGYRIGSTLYGNVSIRSTYDNSNNSAGLEFYVASSGTTTSEVARITKDGNLSIGTTSSLGNSSRFSVQVDGSFGAVAFARNTDNTFAVATDYYKSRGSAASPTAVQNGDDLYQLRSVPYQGSAYTYLNSMVIQIDGTYTSGQNPPTRISWYTNTANGSSTERMRLDASGNLGIGTSSPSVKLEVAGAAKLTGTNLSIVPSTATSAAYVVNTNTGGNFFVGIDNSTGASFGTGAYGRVLYSSAAYPMAFFTNDLERARIDSSGNLLVSTTSSTPRDFTTGSGGTKIPVAGGALEHATTNANCMFINRIGSGAITALIDFRQNASSIGSISYNGTLVVYNTTSDYRLKTVVGAVTGHGARIDALEPIEYTWNSNGSRTRGFLAHKFQEVYADSVTGEKDAVDADGNPVYQSMQASTSEVIADLVAEIQSLRKRLADAGI